MGPCADEEVFSQQQGDKGYSELQRLFPSAKELGCRPQISETIFRYFPRTLLSAQLFDVQSGDAVGFWAVDSKGLAVEIRAELPERAVECELVEEVTVS